jgi:hypothetical protein
MEKHENKKRHSPTSGLKEIQKLNEGLDRLCNQGMEVHSRYCSLYS